LNFGGGRDRPQDELPTLSPVLFDGSFMIKMEWQLREFVVYETNTEDCEVAS